VAEAVLALVAFPADNHSESRLVSGLLETGFVPVWDLLFPFSMAMALINGIPHSMVQSLGSTEFRSINGYGVQYGQS